MSQTIAFLGIDISQAKFHVALLKAQRQPKIKVFVNQAEGFEQLSEWLIRQGVAQVHACLEATNVYGNALAIYLHQQGHQVSVVNPAQVKGFAQCQLSRTKTDRADAVTIARFCERMQPLPWKPPSPEVEQLQALTRRLEALEQMITQERNRLKTAPLLLQAEIEAHIQFMQTQVNALKKQVQAHIHSSPSLSQKLTLMTSIVGIGVASAAHILAEIGALEQFDSARQLAAYSGLTPQEHTSGSSVLGKTRLCKVGNPHLRKALYFPALVAIRRCPVITAFRDRLLAAGKTKMQAIGAVMHKLLRIIYGVLKSQQPFDPDRLCPP